MHLNPQVYLVGCRNFNPTTYFGVKIMFLHKQRWARCFRDDKYYGAIDTNNDTESLNKALKYSFLPRKKNMTLTGMVKLLTEQFLPDIHQHYLFENYRQLPFYRAASDTVPDYLHKTNSNKFTAEAVQTTEKPGVFHVVKASRGKHIVDFGAASSEGTPSCSCKDWTRWHIPCKHFFAVFRVKPEWSWNTLPKQYTESAYLSTDNEALVAYFSSQGVPEEDIQVPPEVWHTDSPIADLEESVISDTCNFPLDVDSNPPLHGPGTSEDIECEIPKRKVIITGSTLYRS